jgi:microcystin-dependent protein
MRNTLKFLAIALLGFACTVQSITCLAADTPNKGYTLQGTGTNRGTWGIILNNILSTIDLNLGGMVTVNVAGSSDVTANSTQAKNIYHKLTGTLTGNIEYIVPDAGAFYIVENATSGAFTLEVSAEDEGVAVTVPQGKTVFVFVNAADTDVVPALNYFSGGLLAANNLSDISNAATAFSNIKQAASESATGVVELATTSECSTGSDTARACTAAGVAAAITAQVPVELPVGSIVLYGGTSAPSKYFLAYGQAVSRTTYSALFSAYGTTYGVGDGSTTFNLPDLRGRAPFGQDDMGGSSANRLTGLSGGVDGDVLGAAGGEEAHTLSTAEMPAHNHGVPLGNGGALTISHAMPTDNSGNESYSTSTTYSQNTGDGGAHNTVPPALILNYIIYHGVP